MEKHDIKLSQRNYQSQGRALRLRIHSNAAINCQLSTFNLRAFTLIELMISIALVLLLILGVNQIFSYTTQAVGAGQAINAAIRDSRAFGACASSDFAGMVSPGTGPNDSASLIISSSAIYAFRDKRDQAGDLDGDPHTRDLNNDKIEGDSSVPGEVIYPYTYNYRNHRTDVVSFFARNMFARQTGNLGTVVDNMFSQEAWVWYGHLWLPDNTGNYFFTDPNNGATPTFPGLGTSAQNPNNLYATQFVLGRVAVLLQEKSADSLSGTIQDSSGYYQRFINRRLPYPASGGYAADLEPLCSSAYSDTTGSTGDTSRWNLQNSRFDLAATSIKNFRDKLATYIAPANGAVTSSQAAWWDQMMDGMPYQTPPVGSGLGTRFQCNPFVSKPMSSDVMAQATPYCLGGCGQFIVEYAGDYFTQDNNPADATYGNLQSNKPDGQIDYINLGNAAHPQKQIIWYGFPRNTSGQAGIQRLKGDVVPLADWLNSIGLTQASHERVLPYSPASGPSSMVPQNQKQYRYICAWGPNDTKPKLIRITITLDDATGRLPEGQTYQYVFAVP